MNSILRQGSDQLLSYTGGTRAKYERINERINVAVVTGEKDGARLEYRLRAAISPDLHQKMKDKGCSGSYRAGVCAAAAAVLIGRGQVHTTGVVAPELAIPPEPYFSELSKFGFKLELTRKSLL